MRQDGFHGVNRWQQVVEMDNTDGRVSGQWFEVDLGFQQHGQRPFAARDEFGQIPRLVCGKLIEVVSADATHDLREAGLDFSALIFYQGQEVAINGGFTGIAHTPGGKGFSR